VRSSEADVLVVGLWLAEARRWSGRSQSNLGGLTGVHQSTISRIERGLVPGAQLHHLAPILLALQTELVLVAIRDKRALRDRLLGVGSSRAADVRRDQT
jgi:predicted transcriptional regulator